MATATPSMTFNASALTLANYKQGFGDFSTALTAVGFTKTADTGQVNYSTVASVPTSPGTDYEIRQFTDANQANSPFFVKIETYAGQANGAAAIPSLRISVGTGTSGTGVLTGNVSDLFINANVAAGAGPNTTFTNNNYISGDGSRICWVLMPANNITIGQSGMGGGFAIERLKDANGNDTLNGVVIILSSRNSQLTSQVVFKPTVGTVYPSAQQAWTVAAPNSGTAAFAGNIGLFPVLPNIGYPNYPCISCLGFFFTDSPTAAAQIGVSLYGTSRNYINEQTSTTLTGSVGINGNASKFGGYWIFQ